MGWMDGGREAVVNVDNYGQSDCYFAKVLTVHLARRRLSIANSQLPIANTFSPLKCRFGQILTSRYLGGLPHMQVQGKS